MREKIAEMIIKGRIDDKNSGEIADLILALPVGTRKEKCIDRARCGREGCPAINGICDTTTGMAMQTVTLSEALETLKEIIAIHSGHPNNAEFATKVMDLLDGLEVTL